MMSVLILAVGWAYTQICRIYPDGGGVYTAAKHRSRMLAVIGALLLFADYTVTASLSVLDAFHYFGLPLPASCSRSKQAEGAGDECRRHRDAIRRRRHEHHHQRTTATTAESETLFAWDSPGLWAIVAIALIGMFNLMGPKHTGGFAIVAAVGMVVITLLITCFALPQDSLA